MANLLETPSRIMRRIEALDDNEMPSLPSIPAFDDSVGTLDSSADVEEEIRNLTASPLQSTPASASSYRAQSASSSATRFAHSVARSISVRSSLSRAVQSHLTDSESFDVSPIVERDERLLQGDHSKESVPGKYLTPEDSPSDDDIHDALQSVSYSTSPYPTHKKQNHVDYFVPLKPEPQPSTLEAFKNVATRRPAIAGTRTPSLTRTNTSLPSSPSHSTPSNRSLALDRAESEPASLHDSAVDPQLDSQPRDEQDVSFHESDTKSMDITEAHISPLRNSQSEESSEEAEEEEGDEMEPTFSSEGDQPSNRQNITSTPFTPVSMYPRGRVSFAPSVEPTTPAPATDTEPLTPHTRRRSFLLSVINSTTRPRLKYPTPHPRNKLAFPGTPGTTESTPSSSNTRNRGVNLQTAFAGVTPRPSQRARRLSHPLAEVHTASSETESDTSTAHQHHLRIAWTTPSAVAMPPYDGAPDRESFISTASSHDLTTHPRANTSFDPAMGFGVGSQGVVGRFNAGKLNSYLHGLNRRLQEENEALMERLKLVEGEKQNAIPVSNGNRRQSGGIRRVSAGGTILADVEEDVGAEGWIEEKAELEALIDAFKDEVTRCMAEKEAIEAALEEEKDARVGDKERWKERMDEAEDSVKNIVDELERQLCDAETRAEKATHAASVHSIELEKRLQKVLEERDMFAERAARSEAALHGGTPLGGELKDANDRISQILGDLGNANAQIKGLEKQVLRADERIDELERDLKEEQMLAKDLEKELQAKVDDLDVQRERIQQIEEINQRMVEDSEAANAYATELERRDEAAVARLQTLEEEVYALQTQLAAVKSSEEQAIERVTQLGVESQKCAEQVNQMTEALEEAEKLSSEKDIQITDLQNKLLTLQRTNEYLHQPSRVSNAMDADIDALEEDLNDAQREIARLNAQLAQSPARRAIEQAKDTRIEMLEKENEELLARIKILRATSLDAATPSKLINTSGISPMHRRILAMSVHAPKTPGTPLKEMSWLNTTTEASQSPLLAEISRLQRELDQANDCIDDKLGKLEDAGLGVVELTKKLGDAHMRIANLEDDVSKLVKREGRHIQRLKRAKCQKCLLKLDLRVGPDESSLDLAADDLPTEPPTPPTRSTNALRQELRKVNNELVTMKKRWDEEKQPLVNERTILQDANARLNVQVQDANAEVTTVAVKQTERRVSSDFQEELELARNAVSDLERELQAERAYFRQVTAERNLALKEKESVLVNLQRAESDIGDVRKQLETLKNENRNLEAELRMNTNADRKARLLEARVTETTETIERLRGERALLAADHDELQKKLAVITERADRLHGEYLSARMSHGNRRQELDLHLAEISDLKAAVARQADELQSAEAEKDRLVEERKQVSETVDSLRADLRRVRKDAEAFGRDLRMLRTEKERLEAKQKQDNTKADRLRKQLETQVRLLNEQLGSERLKTMHAQEDLRKHVCAADPQQLSALRLQHNKECKGLIVQIRYLKAKFTRESLLRFDVAYQKQYLLMLLSKMEKSEQTIFAAIAKIGFPVLPPPPRRRRKLKTLALCAVFLARVRRTSHEWRQHIASRQAVGAALEDVRRRRG